MPERRINIEHEATEDGQPKGGFTVCLRGRWLMSLAWRRNYLHDTRGTLREPRCGLPPRPRNRPYPGPMRGRERLHREPVRGRPRSTSTGPRDRKGTSMKLVRMGCIAAGASLAPGSAEAHSSRASDKQRDLPFAPRRVATFREFQPRTPCIPHGLIGVPSAPRAATSRNLGDRSSLLG